MGKILPTAGGKIVHDDDRAAEFEQFFREVAADEPGAAGHETVRHVGFPGEVSLENSILTFRGARVQRGSCARYQRSEHRADNSSQDSGTPAGFFWKYHHSNSSSPNARNASCVQSGLSSLSRWAWASTESSLK